MSASPCHAWNGADLRRRDSVRVGRAARMPRQRGQGDFVGLDGNDLASRNQGIFGHVSKDDMLCIYGEGLSGEKRGDERDEEIEVFHQ
jgi:hypothetical protein